ncbi:hypothetical protein Tco_0382299 [Tanacetum coccineum]
MFNCVPKVPSNKTTKRNKPVEKIRVATKPKRQDPKGHRFSINKTITVHEKTTSPRSCLRWQPTGRILKTVCLRWDSTRKTFALAQPKVESEPPMVQMQISLTNVKQTSFNVSAGLVLHQMTSDHNRSELGIQDHSNEPSSSKLVPKVVNNTKSENQKISKKILLDMSLGIDNIYVVRLGINPMIQPEPEDLPKDNPKLEIAVLRTFRGFFSIHNDDGNLPVSSLKQHAVGGTCEILYESKLVDQLDIDLVVNELTVVDIFDKKHDTLDCVTKLFTSDTFD